MTRLKTNTQNFLQYGVASDLAERAVQEGLTVTKVRTLSNADIIHKFSLTKEEAKAIKHAVQRQPINQETLHSLLERSNYTCNICKGVKSSAFIVHHINAYANTQDNDERNLIVLCPADHDLAHNSGLSMGISIEQLQRAKQKWEHQVEKANAAKAAKTVDVNEGAIDYLNIRRIEELSLGVLGNLPDTRASRSLKARGILDADGHFQQKFVQERLSGGRYLFDYINSGETLHYRDLMASIAKELDFADLSDAIDRGKSAVSALEGKYAFFIGGVYSTRPSLPITSATPMVMMHYTKRKIRVEWPLDPLYLFSMSAIQRQGSKNRYIIYCLVRTVDTDGQTLVKASPLLVAQPSKYANRIPGIGWEHRYAGYDDGGPDDDSPLDDVGEGEAL